MTIMRYSKELSVIVILIFVISAVGLLGGCSSKPAPKPLPDILGSPVILA